MKPTVTLDRLRHLLEYEPETGLFRRLVKVNPNTVVGSVAGTLNSRGYWQVRIDGRIYTAHRLAWLYVHGRWPKADIDHINDDRADNRIANLREATRSQNLANKIMPANSSGYRGVYPKRGKWYSAIRVCGKTKFIGHFDKPEVAHAAYVKAARKFFGEFARV